MAVGWNSDISLSGIGIVFPLRFQAHKIPLPRPLYEVLQFYLTAMGSCYTVSSRINDQSISSQIRVNSGWALFRDMIHIEWHQI